MYMGGTDKNDQMTKLQRCRCHYKFLVLWWNSLCGLFYRCIYPRGRYSGL